MYKLIVGNREIETEDVCEAMEIMWNNKNRDIAFNCGGAFVVAYNGGKLVYSEDCTIDDRYLVIDLTEPNSKCFKDIPELVFYLIESKNLLMIIDTLENEIMEIAKDGTFLCSQTLV